MTYIEKLSLHNLRGISGTIKLSSGLNIILGPNNMGKTTLLESMILPLVLNHTNTIETYMLLHVYEAARGSIAHALYSLASGSGDTGVCIELASHGSSSGCINIYIKDSMESLGNRIVSTVSVTIKSASRDCSLTYLLKSNDQVSISINGTQCQESVVRFAAIPSGIMPYNIFDTIIGKITASNPDLVDSISIEFGNEEYKLDLGIDAWNRAVVIIKDGSGRTSLFYSIGRGLQRAFQILFMTAINDIVLVDEIESAMHPELLREFSSKLVSVMNGTQVILTSQSIEAVTALASAILDPDRTTTDRNELFDMASECSDSDLNAPIRLLVVSNENGELKYIPYDGCYAIRHIAGADDPRLTYKLIHDTA